MRLKLSDFGEFPSVETLLGPQTLEVLASPDRIESFLIEDGPRRWGIGFRGCFILAPGPLLNEAQKARLVAALMTPEAHYNGRPIYKRLPSVPNFAYRIWREATVLDVLVDLQNPGWMLHCEAERYDRWNWVGREMRDLAKELFPEFASAGSRSIWKKSVIKSLHETRRAAE